MSGIAIVDWDGKRVYIPLSLPLNVSRTINTADDEDDDDDDDEDDDGYQ